MHADNQDQKMHASAIHRARMAPIKPDETDQGLAEVVRTRDIRGSPLVLILPEFQVRIISRSPMRRSQRSD